MRIWDGNVLIEFQHHLSGFSDANLTVTTSPIRGTCKRTLTNYDTRNVIAQRETAGKAKLRAVINASASPP
jgi:hypothetical protein